MCYCTVCSYHVDCGDPNCKVEICEDCEDSVYATRDPRREQWKRVSRDYKSPKENRNARTDRM